MRRPLPLPFHGSVVLLSVARLPFPGHAYRRHSGHGHAACRRAREPAGRPLNLSPRRAAHSLFTHRRHRTVFKQCDRGPCPDRRPRTAADAASDRRSIIARAHAFAVRLAFQAHRRVRGSADERHPHAHECARRWHRRSKSRPSFATVGDCTLVYFLAAAKTCCGSTIHRP